MSTDASTWTRPWWAAYHGWAGLQHTGQVPASSAMAVGAGLLDPHEVIRFYDTTLDDDDPWRRGLVERPTRAMMRRVQGSVVRTSRVPARSAVWSAGILARVRNYLKHTRQPSILVLAGATYADG